MRISSAGPWLAAFGLLAACSGTARLPTESLRCQRLAVPAEVSDPISALDLVSDLAEAGCPREAIALGTAIRENYREKTYSISAEMLSLFVPEDVLSEYILESFERAYLSILMASAYWRIGKKDEAAVELRRSDREGRALIYNYGEDPVNAFLAAALWDNLDQPETARPFWKKLSTLLKPKDPAARLARERIQAIDRGGANTQRWRIVGLGRFPTLDWSYSSEDDSYWRLVPRGDLAKECRSNSGAALPTSHWIEKIGRRYASDYHPFLHAKSWVRLPIGIAYGVATFGAGLGVTVGGCTFDVSNNGSGEVCRASAQLGLGLMSNADVVSNYALRPDLRHWRRLPAGILVTTASDLADEPCWSEQAQAVRLLGFELAR